MHGCERSCTPQFFAHAPSLFRKTLDHPNIVRVMETYNYNNQIFVVMELCSGGDLYTRDPYTEEEAAKIIASILSAVSFMHSRGV